MDTQSTPDGNSEWTDDGSRSRHSAIRRYTSWYLQTNIDHSTIRGTSGWTLLLALVVTTALATAGNLYQSTFFAFVRPLVDGTGWLVHPTLLIYIPLIGVVIGAILMGVGSLSWADIGIVRSDLRTGVATLVVTWLLMQAVGAYTAYSNGLPFELPAVWNTVGVSHVIGDFLGQLFGNAPFEEIVFRGVLLVQGFKLLRARLPGIPDRLSFAFVLIVTQVIFALYHIPTRLMAGVPVESLIPVLVLPFIFGIMLSLVYYRTGNLFVPIVLHTFLNAPLMVVGSANTGMETVFLLMIAIVVGWPVFEGGFDRVRARTGVAA